MGQLFSDSGIALLRFDFSGCGQSDGRIEESTLSGRVADLEAVLDFMEDRGWHHPFGLMGSSFGGYAAILAAAQDKRVGALATLATPLFLGRLLAPEGVRPGEPVTTLSDTTSLRRWPPFIKS